MQLAILCQLPANQLFVLRQVSHSCNNVLCNPNLLDDINASLPFLTSAPDLTSRKKRRMRMMWEEPVLVKSFDDVFPWASPYREDLDMRRSERFLDWCLVFLTGYLVHDVITLTIGGLHTKGMAQVDILAVLKEVNPKVYREWSEDIFLEANV